MRYEDRERESCGMVLTLKREPEATKSTIPFNLPVRLN